ncbi:MAG TPA: hypothetical protein VK860_10105 [Ilumatobacteraceae bacterium]|nr:hypothetical protein [Ilumatobacteraceae bacterium]
MLEVTDGTLDIQSAPPNGSFTANGTIEVGPGATVSIADDLALAPSSEIEIGIAGPATFPANFGRIVLPTGNLTAAGTLRTVVAAGYEPTTDDVYPILSCSAGDCSGGDFDTVAAGVLTVDRTPTGLTVRGAADPIGVSLDFDFGLAAGAPATLAVAPSGIAINALDRNAVARSGGGSPNVAASSITSIGPEDTSLASIQLGATPLRAVILESDELSAIPLVNIDIEGGWERILSLSEDLRREPLSSLTFGQVLAAGDPLDLSSPAGALAATPLRAVDVAGTPLRAVSLAAIALGATPLRAVPLRAVGPGEPNPWCEFLGADLLAEFPSCDDALDELSLLEATLRGASIEAAPLRAVPLRAVNVAESPLRAVLVEDIALGASSIGSIPLRAVPLRAVELQASPLRAVPLRAVPLRAVPVSAIDLDQPGPQSTPLRAVELNASPLRAVTTSIALDAAPLRAVDVNGTPVSAIQVQGAPLRAVPISAVMLADLPLRAVALEEGGETFEWCDVLASIGSGFDCDSGVDLDQTTINDLSIRGVPLRAVPLRAVPLRAVLAETSIGAIPLRAVPLRAVPLRAVPLGGISLESTNLGSINVNGTPLRAVPLRAVDLAGTSLGAIPLRAVAPNAIPLRAVPLRAVPLRAVPLRAVPLRAVELGATTLADTPLRAVDVLGSPLRAVPLRAVNPVLVDCALVDCERGTLGDALLAGAISGDVTLEQIQSATEGIALAELVAALLGVTEAEILAAIELAGLTLDDLTSLDDLTLGDLPRGIVDLDAVTLGALLNGLSVGTFADLVDAIIDPFTGRPVVGLEEDILDAIAALDLVLGDLERLGDVTLDDVFAGTHPITLADIEPVLRFVTVDALEKALGVTIDLGNLTLGDLTPEQLGQLTLADLSALVNFDGEINIEDLLTALDVGDLLEGFTLGDLLLAFLDPSSLVYGGVDFADVDVASLPSGTIGTATFTADLTVTATSARSIELQIQTPRGASYVTGSGRVVGDGSTLEVEPTRFGDVLTWSFVAQPGVAYEVRFDVLPTLTLGTTSLSGVARVIGTDISLPATANVTVVEGTEPNDFTTPDETTPAAEDIVYLTYIADPDDIDVFEIEVSENDELVVQLSNLDADLDLILWGRKSEVGTGGALSGTSDKAPLFPVTDPDNPTSDSEPLADFPRLDGTDATLGVIGVSNADGTKTETLATGRLAAGTYYIQVYGANGATNIQPAALQLKVLEADTRPECVATELPPFTGLAPLAPSIGSADTLILINESRLEQLHGTDGRSMVRLAADRLVAAAAADPSLGISPVVVPVDAFQEIRDAYAEWDSAGGSCDPDAANAVVAAINAEIIDPVRDQLTHVVILGPDELIPMARLADETQIANEYDYRHEFEGDLTGFVPNGRNALTSSFWESTILSDEPYGESAARSLGNRYLYVTDLALGRVVETPAEIADALDTFVEFDGKLDIDTATVLGYDFLADGSDAIADTLAEDLPVDRELARGPDPQTGEGWTAARATEKLVEAAAANALVSLNAHFDHYRALPAIGDKVVNFDDNLIAEEVRSTLGPGALAQSLVFSMGCHSGLSVSDVVIGRTQTDWPQMFGQMGALYVGNTGFGYGDTKTVAYSEQLMALFADRLTTPFDTGDGSTTVGQALAWAKNDFVAGLQTFSVYDEKVVQEATFYGLPFYRVGLPTEPVPAAPVNVAAPDATGTPALSVSAEATNDERSTDLGVYFSNTGARGEELVIVAPGQPIQPRTTADVSVVDPADPTSLAVRARGAIVLGMESTYRVVADPVIATPIFDESIGQPEPELTSGVFPAKPLDITTTTGPGGERQTLVLATGQYRSDDAVQRLDDDIELVVYYADDFNRDFLPPTIGRVESSITGGVLTVSVSTDVGDAVDRVYVLVAEDPGPSADAVEWRGLDLALGQEGRWTGSMTLTPGTAGVEFIVQAKDAAGNIGYATNKARNFGELNAPPPPPPPPPPAAELSVVVPDEPPSGWYDEPLTITIENASSPATVSVNDVVLAGPFGAGDSFTITANGVQNWRVVTESGRVTSGTVRIDADGAPQVILGTPAAGAPAYASGSRRVDVICRDTSLVSCVLDIDGVTVANGDPLPVEPGSYTLNYIAADALGNVTAGAVPFTIVRVAAPVIRSLTVPTGEQSITSPVTVSATFSDASVPLDSFTATINWGDGSTETVDVTAPTSTSLGSFSGSHVYEQPGPYEVVVSVTDNGGLFDTEGALVTVVAPSGSPVITAIDAPTTPQLLSAGVVVRAEFTDASAPFDTFTALVDWGDGTTSPATITPPTSANATGSLIANKVYAETGVYPVTVTVTDASGGSDSELYEFVVVFDPTTNGRVSGSGAYWSGAEASAGTSRWGAPAFFGYNARYRNNATLPSGETQLRLLGQFLFKSTSYDYLIVNDSLAIAEGVGTAGGRQYRFRVQGIDNGWLDFFQITIWNPTTGEVLYDNGVLYDKGDLVLLGGIRVKGG